jgi:2,3-bisphosphoglycerate-dependent phosphoglycerate mutase
VQQHDAEPSAEPTRIVLVRHGQTDWNVATRIQGHTDEPLNAHGHWQAQQLAQALAHEELVAVYASDLQRAHATALPLAQQRGVVVQHDASLRERHFGQFEGATFKEIDQRWPDDARRWRQRDAQWTPAGGGESLALFYERVVSGASALAARHPGQGIALVSHGGALDCLYRAALGLALDAPRSWVMGNASINRLLYTGRGFSLVGWNDDGHLHDATLLGS